MRHDVEFRSSQNINASVSACEVHTTRARGISVVLPFHRIPNSHNNFLRVSDTRVWPMSTFYIGHCMTSSVFCVICRCRYRYKARWCGRSNQSPKFTISYADDRHVVSANIFGPPYRDMCSLKSLAVDFN